MEEMRVRLAVCVATQGTGMVVTVVLADRAKVVKAHSQQYANSSSGLIILLFIVFPYWKSFALVLVFGWSTCWSYR